MSADGRKNQIMMTFSTAGQFHQNLTKFMEFYRGLGEVDSYNLKQGELKTEAMYKDDKKYHMDLKENARGSLSRTSESCMRDSILALDTRAETLPRKTRVRVSTSRSRTK